MTVRLGQVEIKSVSALAMDEARTLVEQRVPEQAGAVFQDLGRDPVSIVMEGEFFGDAALASLEELRRAMAQAQPLAFAADIATGSDITEVVIEELRVAAMAGFLNRYRFAMRVREHIAPPASPKAEIAAVDTSVAADGAAWEKENLAAVRPRTRGILP